MGQASFILVTSSVAFYCGKHHTYSSHTAKQHAMATRNIVGLMEGIKPEQIEVLDLAGKDTVDAA